MVALAGIVHDREAAAGHEHNRAEGSMRVRDIRWQHRYKDITSVSPHGRFLLDYTKFHDTVSEE
jgi:hypothetical protein